MDHARDAPSLGLSELRVALASPDPSVRARAIPRVRPEPGVQETLLEALRDTAPDVRRAAVRTLARLGGPGVTGALVQVSANDLTVSVRAEAVSALGRILEARIRREAGSEEPGEGSAT
jgi:HEAT repeat protein